MATMNFGGTVADRVAADAGGGGAPVDPIRYFPDPDLEIAVRTEVDVWEGDIHQSDLDRVTSFTAGMWAGIQDLTGMEYWITLTHIGLDGNGMNPITDISPLASLTNLTWLSLGTNAIADISPLASLTGLTYLDISYNSIVDVSPLATLTNLTTLYLSVNSIIDISGLASLTALTDLQLEENEIVDISDLVGLTSLTTLNLNTNSIVNFSILISLTSLLDLSLANNGITDISDLATLTSLTALTLSGNNIIDVSPLASLIDLTNLQLNTNNIIDISPLVGVLDSGDYLAAAFNPLNVHAYSTDIPALQLAGVSVDFDPEPTPTVVSIDPVSGTTAGGTPVTITGTNFLDGATVTIDGNPCTGVVFVDSTSLTAVTPAGTAGAKDVVVTNNVEFGTLAGGYTYT